MTIDSPVSDDSTPAEKQWRGLRPRVVAAIIVALAFIALGYYLVGELWLVRRHFSDVMEHNFFALWLLFLFIASGALIGSVGVGSRIKEKLTANEMLLLGIALLVLGCVLLGVRAVRQQLVGPSWDYCLEPSDQIVSGALYAAVVGFFGAFFTALGGAKESRHSPRAKGAATITIIAVVAAAALFSNHVVYETGFRGPRCHLCPEVDLIPRDYVEILIIIEPEYGAVNFDFFLVSATANGTVWAGLPVALQLSSFGQGPSGEWLSFVDLDGGGYLSTGDYFTLWDPQPDTEYGIALLDAMCATEIASTVIQT